MWEPYLGTVFPMPTEEDRARLEGLAGGPLPPAYWELAVAHQGEALRQEQVADPAFEAFILLLVVQPERLEEADAGYSIAVAVERAMPYYPAGLLPFADDTGGNLWAFDYRADPSAPSIVFIDHEVEGEEGVTAVAPSFEALLSRIGLAPY